MAIITAGRLLPGMSCPCVLGIDSVIWTVGQQAGFALFLDEFVHSCAVKACSLSVFATQHVAFCNNCDFCIVLNPL